MPQFKYYNVQLLPLNTKTTGNVGVEGYRELFRAVGESVRTAIKEKQLESIAAPLRNDMYFVPFRVNIGTEFACGEFLKFNHIDALRDLYTGDEVQRVGHGVTNKRYSFDFAFDFKRHILAIARAKGLPTANPLIEAIDTIVTDRASALFPQHTVRVIELTESESLEAALTAEGYKRVEVTVTFSNSDETEEELESILEQDLRENNVHDVQHVEKSAKDTSMSGMSRMARGLVGLATKYGNATIRYIKDQTTKLYQMKDHPVMIEVKRTSDDADMDFYKKVYRSIGDANARAVRTPTQSGDTG